MVRFNPLVPNIIYEGWNFNFGNAAVTFDKAHLQSSYFHRPSMYSPTLCRTRSQQWGSHMMPLAAPVLLMVRAERPTASIMSGIVLKRLPRSGSVTLGIKSKSQGLMSGEYEGWYSTSHCHLTSNWFTTSATCGRALRAEWLVCFHWESVVSSSAMHSADGAPRNWHSTGLWLSYAGAQHVWGWCRHCRRWKWPKP